MPAPRQPLCVSYAEEFKLSREIQKRDESSLVRRANRFIVHYIARYVCYLNLGESCAGSRYPPIARSASEIWGQFSDQGSPVSWRAYGIARERLRKTPAQDSRSIPLGAKATPGSEGPKFGWVAALFWALFFGCEAYLVLVALRQYRYDFYKLRLLDLQSRGPASEPLRLALETRMAQSKAEIDELGSGYSHLTILVGCFYMTVVCLCGIVHLPINAHHIFQVPFDYCHIVRDLLDRRREEANVRRLVDSQVAEFTQSNRVFHEVMRGQDAAACALAAGRRWVRHFRASGVHVAGREREAHQMARGMLARGALTPLYKLPSWIKRQPRLQLVFHLLLVIYGSGFNIILLVAFISLANDSATSDGHHPRPASNMFIPGACITCITLGVLTATLHPPIFMVVVCEQIQYIKQLRRIVRLCVAHNAALIERTCRERKSKQTVLTINSNLIFALMHYKIFVAQLAPMRRTLGTVNVVAQAILFTTPLVVCLHQPYISKLYNEHLTSAQIRTFALAICLSILVPANLVCVPLCYMFARSKDLYHDLASLMAHLKEEKLLQRGESLYYEHAVNYLLRDLSDSGRLLEKLTVRALGIPATYPMLLEALFWYGLIAISILLDATLSERETIRSLLGDPLRVYTQEYA